MTFTRDPLLAEAAARELAVRERNFPALIEAGRVAKDDAEAQIAAWRAIADLFDRGEIYTGTSWGTLHLASSRCLLDLEADIDKAVGPGIDPARRDRLIERRTLISAIHHKIDLAKHRADRIDAFNASWRDRRAAEAA